MIFHRDMSDLKPRPLIVFEQSIGVIHIESEFIVGKKADDRSNAKTSDFRHPLINHIPWNRHTFPEVPWAAAPRQLAVNLPNRQVAFLVSSVPPNDQAQQRRGPSEPHAPKSLHAPAGCCSSWFGLRCRPARVPLRATRPGGCAAGARRR